MFPLKVTFPNFRGFFLSFLFFFKKKTHSVYHFPSYPRSFFSFSFPPPLFSPPFPPPPFFLGQFLSFVLLPSLYWFCLYILRGNGNLISKGKVFKLLIYHIQLAKMDKMEGMIDLRERGERGWGGKGYSEDRSMERKKEERKGYKGKKQKNGLRCLFR